MKEFVKDYIDLCKESGRFYKKHWKGAILLNAAIIGAEFAWYKHSAKKLDVCSKDMDSEKEEEAH